MILVIRLPSEMLLLKFTMIRRKGLRIILKLITKRWIIDETYKGKYWCSSGIRIKFKNKFGVLLERSG